MRVALLHWPVSAPVVPADDARDSFRKIHNAGCVSFS